MPEYQRKLPHFHPDDTWLFLTWRLWGSLPAKPDSIIYSTPGHAFVAQDHILDRSSTGPRWLHHPRIADLRTGQPFWQAESWDHYLRNSAQIDRTTGLATSADNWRPYPGQD
jgi:hypothetical protein